MILLASNSPELVNFALLGIVVVLIGIILHRLKQPYIIAYILAGIMMGNHGFKILTEERVIITLGEFGLILLLFFIGMEINLNKLIEKWKLPIFGTLSQILGSILLVATLGYFLEWGLNRILVLGFIISLSSSAVVIKLLQDKNEIESETGQNVLGILIMQDILIVPMLLFTGYLGGSIPSDSEIILQSTGGILIMAFIIWILKKRSFKLRLIEALNDDHELQIMVSLVFCFGFAMITSLFGLSAALGAFVGGVFINAANSSEWFHDSLHSFRVVFVALFFVSIGLMIDINFLLSNWKIVIALLLAVYISNHFINAVVLYLFSRNWKQSLYGGALMAQIGELSFILASTAYFASIITDFGYQLAIVTIALTLLISPLWIALTKRILRI